MMNQAITTYRPFEDERPGVIGVYINIGFHEVGLFSPNWV